MDAFEQPLEGIFRDGIPTPVLRAFAPLYQALPSLQEKIEEARNCYFWRAFPVKCVDQDTDVVTGYMAASEAAFRLCPQQSATLLKCHTTEPARAIFFCRDEEWQWRSCLMDQTGVRFWPYANAPVNAPWSNGGQTEDFHLEDRMLFEGMSFFRRKASALAVRRRELEIQAHRKHWMQEQKQRESNNNNSNNKNNSDSNLEADTSLLPPRPTVAPVGISKMDR